MWSREQLKTRAKAALNMNFWKIVIVTFLLSVVVGGAAVSTSGAEIDLSGFTDTMNEFTYQDILEDDAYYDDDMIYDEDDLFEESFSDEDAMIGVVAGILIVVILVLFVIVIVAIVVSMIYGAFIGNPFRVGVYRFYIKSLNDKAQVGEIGYGFDANYANVAKIMFLKSLYIFLWSMLFVIPGIIKAYEYYMVPYLLAENPNLDSKGAFELSKKMMYGNKFETFILELSFFGWDLLSGFTFGILDFLYVRPYKELTYAALYEELSNLNGRPGVAFATPNYAEAQESTYTQNVPPVPGHYAQSITNDEV